MCKTFEKRQRKSFQENNRKTKKKMYLNEKQNKTKHVFI